MEFVVVYTEEEGRLDGFRLDGEAPLLGLGLDRHSGKGGEQPCVFLVRLGDGHDRCGVYEHRPDACRAYPMSMWNHVVFQRRDPLCPSGSWPVAEIVRPAWSDALARQHMHFDVYCEVVARWNAHVNASKKSFELEDYLGYLLSVYDRLSDVDDELDENTLAQMQTGWPSLPRESLEGQTDVLRDQLPWLDYLLRARETIDSFFPEVPPQRLLALDPARWSVAFGRAASAGS
jgi:Fe-S-cluster containining protein